MYKTIITSLLVAVLVLMGATSLSAQMVDSFPYFESWENGFGAWQQSQADDLDWTDTSGPTFSSLTGPASAFQGSQYIYVESSSPAVAGDVAILEADFDFSTLNNPEVIFYYHMYFHLVTNGGVLKLDVSRDGGVNWNREWSKAGDQGNSWKGPVFLDLGQYAADTVKIRFHFKLNPSIYVYRQDAALDNLIIREKPTCFPAANIRARSTTDSSAVLTWGTPAKGQPVRYKIVYGPPGFDTATQGQIAFSTTDSVRLTGLPSGTLYEAYVITDCDTNGISRWSMPETFSTDCNAFQAPYSTGFDQFAAPQLSLCWGSYLNRVLNGIITEQSGSTVKARSVPNFLSIRNTNNFAGDTSVAISPRFSDLPQGDKIINFYARAHVFNNTSDLYIGTMTDPQRGSTISILDTLSIGGDTTYKQYLLPIDSAHGYNGSDQYVVLMHSQSSSFDNIAVDDFRYESGKGCLNPQLLNINAVTDSTTELDFNLLGARSAQINWGACGFTQGAPGSSRSTTSKDSFVFTGLQEQSCYDFYIRSFCNPGDTSNWVGPFSFTTECKAKKIPYLATFDQIKQSTGRLSNCWQAVTTGSNDFSWKINSMATPNQNTGPSKDANGGIGKYLYTQSQGGGFSDTAVLLSPFIDVSGMSSKELSFSYHIYGSRIDTLLVEVWNGNTWTEEGRIIGQQQGSSNAPWRVKKVDLSTYTGVIRLRFSTVRRPNCCLGDVAIDNVIIDRKSNTDLSITKAYFEKLSPCLSANDTARVEITNFTSQSYSTLNDPLKLHYILEGPQGTVSDSLNINFAFFAATSSVTIPITNIDLSVPGNYTLRKLYLDTNSFNRVAANDTFFQPVPLKVEPLLKVQKDTIFVRSRQDSIFLAANYSSYGENRMGITEVCHFQFGVGAPANGWPGYLVADDYLEITGPPHADLEGYTLEQYDTRGSVSTHTFGKKTFLNKQGTAVIAVGTLNGSTPDPPESYYHGISSSSSHTFFSGFRTLRVLKNPRGKVIDVVISNGDPSSFSTTIDPNDWQGAMPVSTSTAGIRLAGEDLNDSTFWQVVSSSLPQDPNVRNPGVGSFAPPADANFSWQLNGQKVSDNYRVKQGPFLLKDTLHYVAVYNSPCGNKSDTTVVIIDFSSSCVVKPNNLRKGKPRCQEIEISWNAGGNNNLIMWGEQGFDPLNTFQVNFNTVSGSTFTTGNNLTLVYNRTYEFYVASICNGDTSSFAGPLLVKYDTLPVPRNLRSSQNPKCDSIKIAWSPQTQFDSEVEYGISGFSRGTGSKIRTNDSTLWVSNLQPNTTYDFYVLNFCGSIRSQTAPKLTLTTDNSPKTQAQFIVASDTIIQGQRHSFTFDARQSTLANSYQWDFGNGLSSTNPLVTIDYTNAGLFNVQLITSNRCGADTAVRQINTFGFSTENNPLKRSLRLFPNPTHDALTIQFDAASSSDVTIRITDMRGRVMMERQDNQVNGFYSKTFDVSSLANGVYMVEITSGELRAVRRLNVR